MAYLHYRAYKQDHELQFWRSPTGDEVDFVIDSDIAIEAKSSRHIGERQAKGLTVLSSLKALKRQIIVCRESRPSRIGRVEVLPWRHFVEELWAGDIF